VACDWKRCEGWLAGSRESDNQGGIDVTKTGLLVRRNSAGNALRSWKIGDVVITRLDEKLIPAPPELVFAGGSSEHVNRNSWLKPHFVNDAGELLMSIHGFVVESQGMRIMVDCCLGNDKPRSLNLISMLKTSFYEDLHAAGFPPDTFDIVVCTHLHADHCGWSTRRVDGRWVPTFPKARHLIGRVEFDHAIKKESNEHDWDELLKDTVQPLLDGGLCTLVEVDHRITSELRLMETQGHTQGHVSIVIESKGERAVITGDMIHHPIQLTELDLYSRFDYDVARARRTRERFIADCSGTDTLVLGCHFADPTGGWIVSAGNVWRLEVTKPAGLVAKD
jgi:glyoxylase-like metal-dependent hydrolase (beta-lactamase superfamily II)